MNEAVASSDAIQQDAVGGLVQKADVMPGHKSTVPEEEAKCVVSQVGCSAEAQPADQSARQSGPQAVARPDEQPTDQPEDQSNDQRHTESIFARSPYPLVGLEMHVLIEVGS